MRKLFCLGICLGVLAMSSPAIACDRYLNEYIQHLREIKDLHQFEEEATTRKEANQMRKMRLDVIWDARLAHGNYLKCVDRKQARYRGSKKRQFKNEQVIVVEDTAQSYGLDPNEAVDIVFRNILPKWMRK